jgi:two-component system sensor histidine kinase UhpB
VTGASLTVAIWGLYRTAYQEELEHLQVAARSQARLIESVGRYDEVHSADAPGGPFAATLGQVADALSGFSEFGQTGEFTVSVREGDRIVFLVRHRQDELSERLEIPWTSLVAEPARRALEGESGTMTGDDYRGETVLAAFEPLRLGGRSLALVAKVDRSEVRAPFARMGAGVSAFALVLVLLGMVAFRRVTEPTIRNVQASEQKYRSLFEDAGEAMMVTTPEGEVLDANLAAEELLGYGLEEMLAADVASIYADPRDRDVFRQILERDGRIRDYSRRLRRKDGSVLDCEVTSTLRRGEAPGATTYETVIRDVTGPKRAQKALRDSEAMFRALAAESPCMIFIWQEGQVRYVNRPWLDTMGYSEEELTSPERSVLDLVAPDAVDEAVDAYWSYTRGEDPGPFRCRLLARGGAVRDVILAVRPVALDGRPATMGVVTDLTDHLLAREALEEERQRAQRYLDVAEVLLLGLDVQGRVTVVNRAGLAMLGYEAEDELLGADWIETCHPEGSRAELREEFARLIAGGGENGVSRESPVLTRSGETRVFAWHEAVLRNEAGDVVGTLRSGIDITEQKSLHEAWRFAQFSVDRSGDGVLWVQPDATIIYANDAACQLTGQPRTRLLERRLFDLRPDLDAESWTGYCERLRRQGRLVSEAEIVGAGGRRTPVGINANWLEFEGAEFVVLQVWDVTGRKEQERALRESEVKYRDLVETSHDLIWRCDNEGRFTYLNPAWERSLGYSLEEMLGRPFADFVRPDLVERDLQEFGRNLSGRSTEGYQTVYVSGSGSLVSLVVNALPLRSDAGEIIGAQGTAYDVTVRVRAEEAHRQSEERFRATFEQAAVGIAHAGVDGRFLRVNRRFCDITGYEVDELLGRTFMDITHPDDVASTREGMAELETGEAGSVSYEKRYVRKDGGDIWVAVTVSVARDATLEPLYFIGVIEDITERRRAEKAVRESREALRRLAERLHEVREEERTGIARELHDQVGQELTALRIDLFGHRDSLPGSSRERDGVTGMIELLDRSIGSVQAMSARLRSPILDVLGLEAAVTWQAEEFAKRMGVPCVVDLDPAAVAVADMLSTAVYRIFQEALTNVARHAHASEVTVRLHHGEDLLVLEVADNGVGLPAEAVGSYESLGLISMHERAMALGGTVEVTRRDDGGTLVRAAFPESHAEAGGAP